ncbi:MAG: PadR family transcriptional regulator [Acidobacteria bacterium]|nr:PadR family transcriptional regulator [Acidobacteriota bacterium]
MKVVQGTLDYLVLKTLSVEGVKHGFEILEWILATTDGALEIEEGSLYPALHRMEKRGLIEATWGVSPKGRRAKYYGLSALGERELVAEEKRWASCVEAVGKIAVAGPGS